MAKIIINALREGTFDIRPYSIHGHFYFNLLLLPLHLANLITPISEHHVIVSMRVVMLFFSIVSLLMVFILSRRFFDRLTAWWAVIMISVSNLSPLYTIPYLIPDIIQLFFVLTTIYFVCRYIQDKRLKWIYIASIMAGIAQSTKYVGMILIPLIIFIIFYNSIKSSSKSILPKYIVPIFFRIRYLMSVAGIILILIAFFITPRQAELIFADDGNIDNSNDFILYYHAKISLVYFGLFLTILSVISSFWSYLSSHNKVLTAVIISLISIILFLFSFFITSPFLSLKFLFIKSLYNQFFFNIFQGVIFNDSLIKSSWINLIIDYLGWFIAVLAFIGILIKICNKFKLRDYGISPQIVVYLWIMYYLSFMILFFNVRHIRYVYPVLPFLIIIASTILSNLTKYIIQKYSIVPRIILLSIVILIVSTFYLLPFVNNMQKYLLVYLNFEENQPKMKAGRWLSENYPANISIYYDSAAYVPSKFINVNQTWWCEPDMLTALNSDLLVMSKIGFTRYADINLTNYNPQLSYNYAEYQKCYNGLRKNKFNYSLIKNFKQVRIYKKKT